VAEDTQSTKDCCLPDLAVELVAYLDLFIKSFIFLFKLEAF